MRIRLKPDGQDRYKVILPGKNGDYPIGVVWKDILKKSGWKIKPYFVTLYRNEHLLRKKYSDSMEAARKLAEMFNKMEMLSSQEITDKFEQQFPWPDYSGSD